MNEVVDFDSLRAHLAAERQAVVTHLLFNQLKTLADVRNLMEVHVFAVWDFMSLVKRLQIELTSVTLPWIAKGDPRLRRAINEIVLGEESDLGPDGQYHSHFELYLAAMAELGADTSQGRALNDQFAVHHSTISDVVGGLPKPIGDFVAFTLQTALTGKPEEVAAVFCFGREDLIPDMFAKLLPKIATACPNAKYFAHYLARHIEVDGESHGPLSRMLMEATAGTDALKWSSAAESARRALELRRDLWTYASMTMA